MDVNSNSPGPNSKTRLSAEGGVWMAEARVTEDFRGQGSSRDKPRHPSDTKVSFCCLCHRNPANDARYLPCQHAYCLACLQGYYGEKQAQSVMRIAALPCPLSACRRMAEVPREAGVAGFPTRQISDQGTKPDSTGCQPDRSNGVWTVDEDCGGRGGNSSGITNNELDFPEHGHLRTDQNGNERKFIFPDCVRASEEV